MWPVLVLLVVGLLSARLLGSGKNRNRKGK